ncbi:MAG TPA: hypothetical protein ACFCUD_05095 [Cyclobacteriaceae bacterium]
MTPHFNKVILVFEKQEDCEYHKELLIRSGYVKHVDCMYSGRAVLDYLLSSAKKKESIPELVFIDLHLPITQGTFFLYAFKVLPSSIHETTKLVAVSKNLKKDVSKIFQNENIVAYIKKNINQKEMINLLEKIQSDTL